MKKSKKKIIGLIIGVLAIIILGTAIAILYLPKKEKETFKGFTYKKVESLEYGNINLSDFVEDVTCDETCTYNGKKIEYTLSKVKELKEQEIVIKIKYQGNEYTKTFKALVKDTTAPIITLTKNEESIVKNASFDASSYIEKIEDNYDSMNIEDIKIESEVKTNKVGDYEVKYTALDSSQNENSKTLIIHVVSTEEEAKENNEKVQKNNVTNNNQTTNNKPQTNNNSNNNNNTNANNNTNSNFKNAINKVKLNPMKTRYAKVDNKIGNIINNTINSSMDNYTKLQAIYDYVKNYLNYGIPTLNLGTEINLIEKYHYTDYDVERLLLADYGLDTKYGTCDVYAALYMILARRIGFDAYVINGQAPSNGGRGGHGWVVINAGGTYYFFDPQIEDHLGSKYDLFGKTVSESKMYSNYNINNAKSSFNYFHEKSPLKVNIKISGAINDTKNYNVYNSESKEDTKTIYTDNTKFTINLSLSGTNLHYHIEYYDDNDKRVFKEVNGKNGSFDINFKKVGSHSVTIRAYGSEASVTYRLNLELKEKDILKSINVTHEKKEYEGRKYMAFFINNVGGENLTYKAELIDCDHNVEFNQHSKNRKQFNLYYYKGKTYKIKFSATDSFGNTKSTIKTITT